jgi:NAD(P)-dependent dehydrogenase (short-subunit alcohol dehydrogenase family)
MDLNLGGKLALITGGSRGIGRAVGEALAAEGCSLVLVSRRSADLDIARSQIEGRYNVSVRTDAADLGDSTNVARLARLFPDVDILVNNAGAIPGGTLFDVDEARWRTAWDLKVLGTINMTRAFYPLMKARGGGAIINVIGNAARNPHDPDYICGVTGNAGLTPSPKRSAAAACVTASASTASAPARLQPTGSSISPAGRRRSGSAIRPAGPNSTPRCRPAASACPPRSPRWLRSWRRRNPATPAEW